MVVPLAQRFLLADKPIRGILLEEEVGPSPVTVVRENTDLEVSNTTTETEILNYTIPANYMAGDRGLRVTMYGRVTNNSGATRTLSIRTKLGATEMWESEAMTLSTDADHRPFMWSFEVSAKDSDAAQELYGFWAMSAQVAPPTGEGAVNAFGVASPVYGSSTEDATTDLALVVTAQFDGAHADCKLLRRKYLIELI